MMVVVGGGHSSNTQKTSSNISGNMFLH
ncbi:hypothetical protein Q5M85_18940 [Paraclostridium bifermentans]|nr:hypothetical protein [Paraclostridium bifermentans]